MAYLVDTIEIDNVDATTTWAVDWSTVDHQTDDLLLIAIYLDDDAGGVSGLTGYTALQTPTNAFVRLDTYYKVATSGAEATVTITSNSLTGTVRGYVFRDVDTTTPIDTSAANTYAISTTTQVIPTITTTTNDCTILVFGAVNQTASPMQRRDTARGQDLFYAVISSHSYYAAMSSQLSSGAIADETLTVNSQRGIWQNIALRNKTGGAKPFNFSAGADYKARGGTYSGISAVSLSTRIATFNSLTVAVVTPTTTNTSKELSDDESGTCTQITANLAGLANQINGYAVSTSAIDVTGPMSFTFKATSTNNIVKGTYFIYLEDSLGAWIGKDLAVLSTDRRVYFTNITDMTTVDSSGTIDLTDIVYYGFGFEAAGTQTGNRGIYFNQLCSLTPIVALGGGAMAPLTSRELAEAIKFNDANEKTFSQGQSQDVFTYGVQLGDGTNETCYKGLGSSTEYPFSLADYEVMDGDIDFTILASADDTLDFRNSIFASTKVNDFIIDASSSTSASYLFNSFILKRFSVTWLTGITCNAATFIECPQIDAKGGIFNNCTVQDTLAGATEAAISFDTNSSMDGTEIDVTDTAAGYHIELGTSVTAFTLTDVTFTGTPATDKIHVLATTGTVTISISGITSLVAGDVTSAGATIVISAAPVTVEVTATTIDGTPIENARVYIVEDGTTTVILNALTNASGIATTTFSGSLPQAVEGWVRKSSSTPFYVEFPLGGSIGSGGYTVTALMALDE